MIAQGRQVPSCLEGKPPRPVLRPCVDVPLTREMDPAAGSYRVPGGRGLFPTLTPFGCESLSFGSCTVRRRSQKVQGLGTQGRPLASAPPASSTITGRVWVFCMCRASRCRPPVPVPSPVNRGGSGDPARRRGWSEPAAARRWSGRPLAPADASGPAAHRLRLLRPLSSRPSPASEPSKTPLPCQERSSPRAVPSCQLSLRLASLGLTHPAQRSIRTPGPPWPWAWP